MGRVYFILIGLRVNASYEQISRVWERIFMTFGFATEEFFIQYSEEQYAEK